MNLFTALLSALALAASTTTATPVESRAKLIVVAPRILAPVANDNWPIGTQQTVKWDTSQIPPQAQNFNGSIYLGYNDGTGSENLSSDPLAKDFLLTSGSQVITVPYVVPRDTYFVVLIGDSGDKSAEFTIS